MNSAATIENPKPLEQQPSRAAQGSKPRPRVGFLGVGWIGRHRLESIVGSRHVEVVAIADTSIETRALVQATAPTAEWVDSFAGLLDFELDGVVIATPSALHATQCLQALAHGMAVFCQKPLGRDALETRQVIEAAERADVLLGVDLSYRFMTATRRIHELCRAGDLGEIYAVDLVFHNAYGPDKAWFYDSRLSGGGCVIDLGIHLVDLALWNLGFPKIEAASSRLFSQGKPFAGGDGAVEDYAEARLDLENGTSVRLACSWRLPAGCDAIISGAFYGTKGGAAFRNVGGSFYQFEAEKFQGTKRVDLAKGPDDWGGRAAVDWAERLSRSEGFDPGAVPMKEVAEALDAIYESAGIPRAREEAS